MAEDNVIPFPAPSEQRTTGAASLDPAELTRQLLATGASPQDIIAAIMAIGSRGFEPPKEERPTLRPRRERVARYTIRVDLDGSRPKIWRRLTVPSDLPLSLLHDVLQAAMGWQDYHLHTFWLPTGTRHGRARFLTAYDIEEEREEGTAEADVRLDETLSEVGDRLFYDYDFGDGWDHILKLEQVEEVGDEEPVESHVTGGRRACPPEDVGGMYTYNELVAALDTGSSSPREEWIQEKLDWLPEDFDPAGFDRNETDAAVVAAASGATGPTDVPFSHPELLQMLAALSRFHLLDELLVEAANGPAELSSEELVEAVRPLTILLDLVGVAGADLSAAGYLKPALVERLARESGITHTWIGKANREDHTPPVAQLRGTAQTLGLLRKSRQRLLLTKAGARARQDPAYLWELLLERLPGGKRSPHREAGLLALLAAAAGRPKYPIPFGVEVLTVLGWQVNGGPITDSGASECARPTWQILDVLAPGAWRDYPPAAAVLARAALQPVQKHGDRDTVDRGEVDG